MQDIPLRMNCFHGHLTGKDFFSAAIDQERGISGQSALAGGKQGEPELVKKEFGRYSNFLGFASDGSIYYKTVTPLGHLYIGEIDIESGKVTCATQLRL